jgi:signal transduction histidine kinase
LPPLVVDTALAVVITAFVVWSEAGERQHGEHVPTIGLILLGSLAPALAIRRRAPVISLAIVAVTQVFLFATGTAAGANVPAEMIPAYGMGAYAGRRAQQVVAALGAAVLVLLAMPWWVTATERQNALLFIIGSAGAWLLGTVIRARRAEMHQLADHARRLESERERQTREAVAEERLRIARELHDVVAHNLSVVVVQAQALGPLVSRDPDQARELASSIEDTGREALTEMRHLLGVLRAEDDDSDAVATPPGPQPGIDRLETLIAQVRSAGMAVALTSDGEPGRVDPAVGLSAYRIVQEALTNVLKHAGPARVEVSIRYADDELHLRICDDGRGAAAVPAVRQPPGPGHGLVGMRERVALFGGELRAGPRGGGGFEVRARIPVERAASR